MIRNVLADIMIGVGILVLVIALLFVFNVWPTAGSDKTIKPSKNTAAENKTEKNPTTQNNKFNINKKYIEQNKTADFKTKFAWESNLSAKEDINFDKSILKSEEKTSEKIEIVIPAGSSASVIADKLNKNDIIDRDTFIDALIIFDAEKKLNSGTYIFEKNSSVLEVFSKILVGGGDYRD